jgi:DNA modification methylase
MAENHLYYGDNLEVLQTIASASVDLVYLDPPFNSARNYNVIFAHGDTHADVGAQIEAFTDTWTWTPATDVQFGEYVNGGLPNAVADALSAFRTLLGENDALAYLVNMAPRLVQLKRVLKPNGSLWLHCDPVMSHYLKVMLDAIFDARHFRNEIIWQRTTSKGYQTTRLPSNHDVILVYTGGGSDPVWNSDASFLAYDHDNLDAKTLGKYSNFDGEGRRYQLDNLTGPNDPRPNLTYEFLGVTRRWRWSRDRMQKAYDEGLVIQTKPGMVPRFKRFLDEGRGKPLSDVWTDIPPLNSQAAERLGYPTQKPLALMERILKLASNEGDTVLDPFAGCGTTIDAAQKLDRQWIGIDITYIAVDLIEKRLLHTHGQPIKGSYIVSGIPHDAAGAQALFDRNPFDFERWAVSQINAQPNEKQVGDKGIDGVARFQLGTTNEFGKILVSVKGGKQLNPAMVRDLRGTIERQNAEMGVLITQTPPTPGMIDEVNHSGNFVHPANSEAFPRLQIITTAELMAGKKPKLPPTLLPYIQASRAQAPTGSATLF